ncbi:hypothetical protein M422DRAFT_272915 [Sphaerobolus stellatus SS14]|uniref:Uncharacterized protein n=1 Tax=Sphaerobolus stellatus (strain SS14) TaxID=990650 RepID=A0A0C9UAF8_SPHS4|nr:hypothetical protein M422DRAFT_272915 [Sphaerobolus stellatus SS14]
MFSTLKIFFILFLSLLAVAETPFRVTRHFGSTQAPSLPRNIHFKRLIARDQATDLVQELSQQIAQAVNGGDKGGQPPVNVGSAPAASPSPDTSKDTSTVTTDSTPTPTIMPTSSEFFTLLCRTFYLW